LPSLSEQSGRRLRPRKQVTYADELTNYEKSYAMKENPNDTKENEKAVRDNNSASADTKDPIESKECKKASGDNITHFDDPQSFDEDPFFVFLSTTANFTKPSSYRSALSQPNASSWRSPIASELASHSSNGTWVPVSRSTSPKKPIKSRWVFTTKYHHDGSIAKLNSRLIMVRDFHSRKAPPSERVVKVT
jgi:hypothetical protein